MYGILRVYVSRHWVLIQQGQKRTSGTLVLGLTDGLSCHVIVGTVNQGDSGRAAQALNCRIPAFFFNFKDVLCNMDGLTLNCLSVSHFSMVITLRFLARLFFISLWSFKDNTNMKYFLKAIISTQ